MVSATLSLEDIVKKTADLPSIPAAALAVMREADSATGTASTVASHIAQDQALAVRVLRLANSAYYGLSRQVVDLQEAVVVLGMRCVRNLAMVAATYPWMSRPLKGYGLGPKQMWSHSFGVAVAGQLLARKSEKANEDTVFTAGLLHNLGKVALSIWLENKMMAMMNFAARENATFDQVERKLLGYDHTDVGAYLGEQWNLPKELIDAIRFHHRPNECDPHSGVADCVHVADYLTMTLGYGLGGDGMRYEFFEEALSRLGLTAEDLDALACDFEIAYSAYDKLFENMK
jgi:putative nucleotidyltransferase with HDIG domain